VYRLPWGLIVNAYVDRARRFKNPPGLITVFSRRRGKVDHGPHIKVKLKCDGQPFPFLHNFPKQFHL
jgi:hypothetical protein